MIRAFDAGAEIAPIRAEVDEAIARVLDSGQLVLGPEVEAFEREMAATVGTAHAVGVASGTDALLLSLRALEVGSGDEVITVANAGVPTIAAIRAAGATPRLVDVDPKTLCIDAGEIAAAIGARTRCIIPIHLYGRPAEMDAVLAAAAEREIPVIEDCAQAQGSTIGARAVGSLGLAGCFSFYPTKNLGALGDGGLVATSSADLASRLREQRMYGYAGERHARREGLNSRLDELQAAVLRVKLRHLHEALARRRQIASIYRRCLSGSALTLPADHPGHTYHLFVVRSRRRHAITTALERAEIGFGIHYQPPVHRMDAYRFLELAEGSLPASERAAREVLSLPLHSGIEDSDAERVAEVVRDAAGEGR